MKKLFYAGLALLAVFEVLQVYFIMPMPGSQRMNSLEVAYALHLYRWAFRIAAGLAIAAGARAALGVSWKWKWLPLLLTLVVGGVVYVFNFVMAADKMFQEPRSLVMAARAASKVDEDAVVVGVERNGEARAYPIRYLVYHHQVQDTIAGQRIMVTYCSVCRTGRVFEPRVNGQPEKFRLVGMDHFNAMFEDATTGSWWRQATGEAVAGSLKGATLPEVSSVQLTLKQWFALHPGGVVMQPDPAVKAGEYNLTGTYERGESKSALTGTNHASWQDKSWVLGVQLGAVTKAYDWNRLTTDRIINDEVNGTPIVLVLAADGRGFAGFVRPERGAAFSLQGEVLSANGRNFDLAGRELGGASQQLVRVKAYQEFWHSWRTFHPDTLQDR